MTDAFADLADAQRWLVWREEARGGRLTKVPYAVGGGHASATDPTTWRTRREAEEFAPLFLNGHAGGVGVVLGDIGDDTFLGGVDLDSCLNDGLIADWAAAILDIAATYGEVSPSGQGIKCWFYVRGADVRPFLDRIGVAADAWGCRRSIGAKSADHGPAIELYFSRRFFTVTAQHWTKTPNHIALIDAAMLFDLAALIPQRSSADSTANGRDNSRSARAFREASRLKRQGCTYEALRDGLLNHADPEIAEWTRTKGLANNERELYRLWQRACSQAAEDRPNIEWRVDRLPGIVREAARLLGANPALAVFQRGGLLVTTGTVVLRNDTGRPVAAPRILPLRPGALRAKLIEAAHWRKYNARADDLVDCLPPDPVISALLEAGEWAGVPDIAGLVLAPVLYADGSVRTEAGLDPATGLLLATDHLALPSLPPAPTPRDATAALQLLCQPIAKFPYVGDTDRAVALALLLSTVAFPIVRTVPLIAVSSRTAGTGKGKLVNAAAMLATGQHAAAYSYGKDAVEFEKLLGSILLAGDPIVNIDNCSRRLESDKLCQILVEPVVASRILGRSEAPKLSPRTLWTATGNNLQIGGDLIRRTLLCDLDAGCERPELRHFDFDPVAMARDQRPALVAAALTIMRAYIAAGRPAVTATPFGSFELWTRMVRDPLVWLGLADPVASVENMRASDPGLNNLAALAEAWKGTIGLGNPMSCAAVLALGERRDTDGKRDHPALAEALEATASYRGKLSVHRLGSFLGQMRGRRINDLWFDRATQSYGAPRWQLMTRRQGR